MKQFIFILLAIIGVSQAQTIQYIGAPTTTVISRGNFRTDSIFYLPKRSKAPTDTAALRYQISDSSLYAWTGSQWRKVGADADTLVYSTRAWRQKGDDSLAARINLKVNISDTASMLTPYLRKADTTAMLLPYIRHAGYGLTKSGQSLIVDTLNIATRAWRQKGLDSLAALEVSGSGTTNYVPKFTAGSTIGNSQIFDNGTSVGIGTTTPSSTSVLEIGKNGDAIISAKTSSSTGDSYFRAQSTTSNVLSIGITRSTGMSSPFTNDGGFVFTNGAGGMQIINSPATPIQFFTNNTERLRIFANGRVFIGASPTDAGYQLDINGTLRSVNGANFATTSGSVGVGITNVTSGTKFEVAGNISIKSGADAFLQTTDANNIIFRADQQGGTAGKGVYLQYWNTSTWNNALYVNNVASGFSNLILQPSGGNVGIGTASPTNAKLVVEGSSAGTVGAIMSTDVAGTTSFVRMVGDLASQNLLNWQTGISLRFATSTQAYGTFAEHARKIAMEN